MTELHYLPVPSRGPTTAMRWVFAVLVALVFGSQAGAQTKVDFNREVRPILSKHCFACHGQDEAERKKKLRLDVRDGAIRELKDGTKAIVPGAPDDSELLARVTAEEDTLRMPPKKAGERLTKAEIDVLRRWIEQGASYAEHWAFVKPLAKPFPRIEDPSWPRNGIDPWILARLEHEGMKPSPEADRFVLLRRASLDLRGLPPSPAEVDSFANDASPDAYERAIDRFLADPAYGERWGRMWLDLARYADSAGYGSDPLRTIWRYRDWVIDAFNRNLPYDQFTIEQIAGDLLPNPTLEQRMATAFHRNTMTNTEGGTDDEEFRVAAIKDRADTTAQVWMGLTLGCAKCHSHKYDPITHEEYYKFYGVFNQTADNDQPSEAPTLPAPTPAQQEQQRRTDAEIAQLRTKLDIATPELAEAQARWESELAGASEWRPLGVEEARAESGASIEMLEDRSLRVGGTKAERDLYTIAARTDLGGITAFRLEAIPDPSLPNGGSGRAGDGNFVLSRFSIEAEPASSAASSPVGRFVRVELPGDAKMLSLAEVEVYCGGQNVARTGQAEQSSTDFDGQAARAIDGNTEGDYFKAQSVTHTRQEKDPWWEVKLAEARPIERIVVWNRTDGGLGTRLANARVKVLGEDRKVVWENEVAEPPDPKRELSPSGRRAIALVRAIADFTQDGFAVADAIKPEPPTSSGWAVAPDQAKSHTALFLAKEPLAIPGAIDLTVRLEHRYKEPGYTLGRFRLSVTADPKAPKRAELTDAVLAILDKAADQRSSEERAALAKHYRSITPALQPVRDEIARLEKSRPATPTLPVMVELAADKRRETHILNKGNHLAPGAKVEAGVPAFLHPLPPGAPNDRLGLARWLVDSNNPLTARVAANRLWAQIIGTGLVETEEDFGTQGELPSHPELLDWLAVESMRLRWDTKALLRLIVTSATYRQSSRVTPEVLARDPRNRLLGRAPRFRLEAEMVRDQALVLSGLLSRKLGGPSVYPPQPDGLWQAAFNGERTWATSKGDDRYRRGLYTFWRRTVPYPSMATFDAPSREICAVRRVRTNTPLQAFVTLNDPAYVEAAQALARRIVAEGGATTEDRARFGLRLALARPPANEQVERLGSLYASELERYRKDPQAAQALATEPLGPLPTGADPAEMAAWTAVANVLLNLDGVLTKG
jgi:hypothetical protein